jgi:hypothetical protein
MRKSYPQVYIDAAQDSFLLQLDQLATIESNAAAFKMASRNLALALELYFVERDQDLETEGGALQDLRAVAALLTHDSKAPVALDYLRELVDDVFAELFATFAN